MLSLSFATTGPLSAFERDKVDSLLSRLQQAKDDSLKIKYCSQLGFEYLYNIPDSTKFYARMMVDLAQQNNNLRALGNGYKKLGLACYMMSEYDSALILYKKGLEVYRKIGLKEGVSASYNNIGLIYDFFGDYKKAIEYHLKSLEIEEEIGNKVGMAGSYNNIGEIYFAKGERKKALEYFQKALQLDEEVDNKRGMANDFVNIGRVYEVQKNYSRAFTKFKEALKIDKELNNQMGVASDLYHLATIFNEWNKHKKALNYLNRSVDIRRSIDDKQGAANTLISIGLTYKFLEDYEKAEKYCRQGLRLARKINTLQDQKRGYQILSEIYYAQKNYKAAIDTFQKYSILKDSVLNKENNKAIAKLQAKYESEKKAKEIRILKKEKKVRKLQLYFSLGGLSLLIFLAVVIYRSNLIKQKKNHQLANQNKEIEKKKNEIEQKNKDIVDSVNYAKRIQEAILPDLENIREAFPKSFVLYKPRDIVSGDFYWYTQLHERTGSTSIIAAVDCTGHGIPGAFMSMIGNDLLNKIVKDEKIHQPNLILDRLRAEVIEALNQHQGSDTKDGMDIALCKVDHDKRQLVFAGAFNPLLLIRQEKVQEIPGDKFPIGFYQTENQSSFENKIIELKEEDTCYIFSDGFPDQFGGPNNKKLTKKKFKKMLLSLQDTPFIKRGEILDKKFKEWKGPQEQVDDVLVIGFSV